MVHFSGFGRLRVCRESLNKLPLHKALKEW